MQVCHVSTKDEIELIKLAKERNVKVTCEVCPHHLLLDVAKINALASCKGFRGFTEVRPRLTNEEDQKALWNNIDVIDVFATDHG